MMKGVRVQYKVSADYVEQNKENIRAVMNDLRNDPVQGMNYSSHYLGDGRFMHLNFSTDAETGQKLSTRESFQHFRTSLKASGPIEAPKAEDLDVIGSSMDLT